MTLHESSIAEIWSKSCKIYFQPFAPERLTFIRPHFLLKLNQIEWAYKQTQSTYPPHNPNRQYFTLNSKIIIYSLHFFLCVSKLFRYLIFFPQLHSSITGSQDRIRNNFRITIITDVSFHPRPVFTYLHTKKFCKLRFFLHFFSLGFFLPHSSFFQPYCENWEHF